jgi:hypothetical protein
MLDVVARLTKGDEAAEGLDVVLVVVLPDLVAVELGVGIAGGAARPSPRAA